MPGISVIARRGGLGSLFSALGVSVRKQMLHFSDYTCQTVISDGYVDIGFTGYNGYPKLVIETPESFVLLEGMIYNENEHSLEKKLRDLGAAFTSSEALATGPVKKFFLEADGEFVICVYDKQRRRILFANDLIGRLPLYVYQDRDLLVFARELKFIVPFLPRRSFHKTALFEYLMFGHPLGENTFIEGVDFFPGGTCLAFDLIAGTSIKEPYHVLNIGECGIAQPRAAALAGMRRIFLEVLENRARWTRNNTLIVSLSGGLDSRGTLAGLKHLGCLSTAVTARSHEEESSRAVARAFGVDLYPIEQGIARGALGFDDIVHLKDGLDCHPDLAQLYYNLQDLHDRFGSTAVYYTGIYGGEITRHSHLTSGLGSFDSLVHYLLHSQDRCRYSMERTARIFNLEEWEIETRLAAHLGTFPERNVYRKYLRFRHESNRRFAGEAEDRNRFYFWTITPYYANSLFRYLSAMDENMKNTRLFRDFLFSIDPAACAVPYYNYNLPLNAPLLLRGFGVIERMMRCAWIKGAARRCANAGKRWKRLFSGQGQGTPDAGEALKNDLLARLKASETIGAFFDNPGLAEIIREEKDIQGLERLLIIFASLDNTERWAGMFRKE
ncbi:MAG: hypothetical protein A2268_11255 [Candidatus Raymondbacteria bacterium RifOxyA12_full_50_37]|nr:MAG: hypothetical protein A2268_11255 [Candidatus Raymondbacteria bacterium RifOxyA12_full_50_37]OGJ85584.1 MAG: hypothetical protein A2248_13040 [Candidatus Raymondbacteria bacterium RIFOXYA2_FULL_49_16]OGJ95087.1 MAG: hypothetical protein A2453_07740 [Candidatus Raymondbacteria bacterium RIFOXYC2_FULL_50_21]OGJ99471.1 MAG: hypothetical protein A2350_03820 [Candidatus Raymondbacteria bacterium RifOxyB12_full_50_8]OGK01997.1 MAG: hypothetical protein A2487_08555 [Candidatus Raymondbacteria b